MKLTPALVAACAFSIVVCGMASGQVTLLGRAIVPKGVSANGRVVIGQDANVGRAFQWTREGGLYTFGNDNDMPAFSGANAVSADGTWVVGGSTGGAFRWHGTGTFESIVNLPPPFTGGTATGVSADGTAVSGYSGGASGFDPIGPWYWTQAGGFQAIPIDNASAVGISRNGAVVVGTTRDAFRGFTWTPSGGVRLLQAPAGLPSQTTFASAINFDGTIVVGTSGGGFPTVWRNEVPSTLPLLPGNAGFVPTCLNDLGSIIPGNTVDNHAIPYAAIWTEARGTELFTAYLASFGISFPAGYRPELISSVSSDGLTFTGRCVNPGVSREGFVVTIPAPSALATSALALTLLARRRRRST